MPRPKGLPKTGGRKKGSPARVHHPKVFINDLTAVAGVLDSESFNPAKELVRCYNHAIFTYENYGIIYRAIAEAREIKGLIPIDDRGHLYLRIASEIAKELATYVYPKVKANPAPLPDASNLTDQQKIDLMSQYIDLLKKGIQPNAGVDGQPSSGSPDQGIAPNPLGT